MALRTEFPSAVTGTDAGETLVPLLHIAHRDGHATATPLENDEFIIGRVEHADITLQDPTVSRQHARLAKSDDGQWVLSDLDSRNGIWVDDEKVDRSVLSPNRPVRIGAYTLTLLGTGVETAEPAGAGPLPAMPHTMIIAPDEQASVLTMSQLAPPPVEPEHLRSLLDFGAELLTTPQAQARRQALCELMTTPELRGQCATLIRITLDRPGDDPVVLMPAVSCDDPLAGEPTISRSVINGLVESRQPILATQGRVAMLACPVRSDPEVLDVLYAVVPPECGTSMWLSLAELAAKLYRQAETNWQLRQAAARQTAIDLELSQARRIQTNLIPREPRVPGFDIGIWFEPCFSVGGDYTDVIPLKNGSDDDHSETEARFFVVLADVAGKGLQAALVTTTLHALCHAAAEEAGITLPRLIKRLNGHLCTFLPDGAFVTLAAAVIEPRTGRTTLCNAGHPPPLLIDQHGAVRELQQAHNLILGAVAYEPDCQCFTLQPGESLMFYSDGLTEAVNDHADMLEIAGLRKLVEDNFDASARAQQNAERIKAAVNHFQANPAAGDDRTAIVVQRSEL